MVQEAEQFKDDDEKIRQQVEAKNKLENYCWNVKSSVLGDAKMKTAIGSDFDTVENTINETLKWLEENTNASIEEYETKQKEVESVLTPLIQKAYQSNIPNESGVTDDVNLGPTVSEVD